ncbi:MAG: hypothetical protein APR53_03325 [Methanoculleus sp. SDB]|nr:MAG: hypothetical protein APR53_03325 [Methanoculleus sp. SDB]
MKNTKIKKTAVFEFIGVFSIPVVYLYTIMGYAIKYFRIHPEAVKVFGKISAGAHIQEIKWTDFDYYFRMFSHDQALTAIEKIYRETYDGSRFIRPFVHLVNSDRIHLVYKKELVERLQNFYDIQNCVNKIAETGGNLVFIPAGYASFESITDTRYDSRIKIPLWSRLVSIVHELILRFMYGIGLAVFPLLLVFLTTRNIDSQTRAKKRYRIGLRVYTQDWGFLFRYRKIDFLLDGDTITRENTLFCIETDISQEYRDILNAKKYNTIEIRTILSTLTYDFIWNVAIKSGLQCSVRSCVFSPAVPSYFIKTAIGIIYHYMIWTRFTEVYALTHYVVYTHFEKYHVVRNIVLGKAGIKTWYYIHSTHHNDLFEKPGESPLRHVFYSYLYYDNLVSWGNVCVEIFTRTKNYFTNYYNVGCIWSEHARRIAEGECPSGLRKKAFENLETKPEKVLGVFDTSFGKGVILQEDDIISYIAGILKFLKNNPEIGVLFKPKKVWEEMMVQMPDIDRDFRDVYEELLSHERCYSVGRFGETCEVIAESDLIVSACFTSTTGEALGARKKAIYFDSSSRFKGCYFDKFPSMVAHGYDEFEAFVKYWLYEISDEGFDEYLKNYVQGEIDANLEGKGITLFRELLCREEA